VAKPKIGLRIAKGTHCKIFRWPILIFSLAAKLSRILERKEKAGKAKGWQGQRLARPKAGKAKGWQGQRLARPKAGKAKGWQGQRLARPKAGKAKGWQGQRLARPKAG